MQLHAIISDVNLANTLYRDSTGDNFPDGWAEFDALKVANFGNPAIPASPGQAAVPTERAPNPNSTNILAAKRLVYRYTIFGNQRANKNTTSGYAELPAKDEGPFGGNDFQVTLGGWDVSGGTLQEQQGTFMHELGHTLGLGHGGTVDDHENYKPNYYSVMSYMWQTPVLEMAGSWITHESILETLMKRTRI